MKVLIVATLVALLGPVTAASAPVPGDDAYEAALALVREVAEGEIRSATVNGEEVPLEDALALLRFFSVPAAGPTDGADLPIRDVGVGFREGGSPCHFAARVTIVTKAKIGTPPADAIKPEFTGQPNGKVPCGPRGAPLDVTSGAVSAEVAAKPYSWAACLGRATFNATWAMGKTACHSGLGAPGFKTFRMGGNVGHLETGYCATTYCARVETVFGGTQARDAAVLALVK